MRVRPQEKVEPFQVLKRGISFSRLVVGKSRCTLFDLDILRAVFVASAVGSRDQSAKAKSVWQKESEKGEKSPTDGGKKPLEELRRKVKVLAK